jgi:hypothetical protein
MALSGNLLAKLCEYVEIKDLPRFRRVCKGFHGALSTVLSRKPDLQSSLESYLQKLLSGGKRVWVAVRARPQLVSDENFVLSPNCITATGGDSTKDDDAFFFDRVFDASAGQFEVWSHIQPQLMRCMLRREHACLFAYGQTGSGKTHTMFGNPDVENEEGVAFRTIKNLRDLLLREAGDRALPAVDFSFLEVYNEKIHDLLDAQRLCELSEERVMLEAGGKYNAPKFAAESYVVANVKRVSCDVEHLVDQVGNLLQEGAASRMVGKTVFNPRSSRSHAIATLHIDWKRAASPSNAPHLGDANSSEVDSEQPIEAEQSSLVATPHLQVSRHAEETRLYLVDLAGSERAGQYALSAGQLKEGVNINQSLSTLGRVVGALARGKGDHVPYRDSALTWLLSDAITGRNARAFMVAAIQPKHQAETLSTLRYAHAYSTLQSDLSTRIPKLKSQVRQLQTRRDFLIQQFDSLCFSINLQSRGMRWDTSSLRERHVKLRRTARQSFENHPYLKWTDAHEGKLNISAVGVVCDVMPVPPARDRGDVIDGRLRVFEEVGEGEHVGNVVRVLYEGRHGFPPTFLWYPEAALEDIKPPEAITKLLKDAEDASVALKAKQALLRELEKQFKAQRLDFHSHRDREENSTEQVGLQTNSTERSDERRPATR